MVKLDGDKFEKCSIERKTVNYDDNSGRFAKEGDEYTKQYASLYVKRLEELASVLKVKLKVKWGSDVNLIPLSDLEEQEGRKCAIIGTLFKHQPNKPSILKELSEEHQMSMPAPLVDYCSDEDQLFLEDQTSRVRLTGDNVNVKMSVTGVVCAVLGAENSKSTFEVEEWCFCDCPMQSTIKSKNSGKIVFVSGLELATNPPDLPVSLFEQWVCGLAGNPEMQEEMASVVRVVIAGNSIKGSKDVHVSRGLVSGRKEDAAAALEMTTGTKRLDALLESLGSNCCVTLMPGQFDVTTLMMPQKSMHPGSFPRARRYKSIKGVSNPWIGKVADKVIVGTSGQPIQDIIKVCGLDTKQPLEWLEKTLEWRHMCPTAPDTIPCMPFYKNDPFILKECPHIYFVGNMDKFETKLYKGKDGQRVRLVCIPKFAHTKTVVLVDLDTLDATPVSFGSNLD
ncbi:DNA polymerase delta small subunit-like [Trichogramma pretiosum]|uniref:DNA polymerase delta small subunit-like n=1 Tax=Trichogramma pretiosum TaxID=7493 RepID=UPI0006C9BE9C|nr:DNA polymerase delta small subunit-like [Trichogramma pretiosum]